MNQITYITDMSWIYSFNLREASSESRRALFTPNSILEPSLLTNSSKRNLLIALNFNCRICTKTRAPVVVQVELAFGNNNNGSLLSSMYANQNAYSIQREEIICNRFCEFERIGGHTSNLFECRSHKQVHVCDQNCNQIIPYDAQTSICRLSKKLFVTNSDEIARQRQSVKKRVEHSTVFSKRSRDGDENSLLRYDSNVSTQSCSLRDHSKM